MPIPIPFTAFNRCGVLPRSRCQPLIRAEQFGLPDNVRLSRHPHRPRDERGRQAKGRHIDGSYPEPIGVPLTPFGGRRAAIAPLAEIVDRLSKLRRLDAADPLGQSGVVTRDVADGPVLRRAGKCFAALNPIMKPRPGSFADSA
jgi:hypothetical protein